MNGHIRTLASCIALGWLMPGCSGPVMVVPGGSAAQSDARSTTTAPAAGTQTAPASDAATAGLAPLALPDNFDANIARLKLAELPDDPPAPDAAAAASQPALSNQGRRRFEAAKRLFSEQRFTETIAEVERAVRYDPQNADAHRLMALACLLSGNEARARQAAERAIAIQPNDAASHYVIGRFAERAGKAEEAVRAYRLALKCTPREDDASYQVLANYHLGNLLFERGYYTASVEALSAFESGIERLGDAATENPELATVIRVHRGPAAIRRARAHAYLGQNSAAADALRAAAQRNPKDLELRAEYIRALVRAQRGEEALREVTRYLEDSGGVRPAVELLLIVHRATGHPERGLSAIESVVRKQPDNIELWTLYADALLDANRPQDAERVLRELLARHPESQAARNKLIDVARRSGSWSAWLGALVAELVAEPTTFARVDRQIEQLSLPEAREVLKVVSESPATTQPAATAARSYVLGRLHDQLGQFDPAKQAYDAALAEVRGYLPAAVGRAELYLSRCRWKEAIESIEVAQAARSEPAHQLERLLGRAYDGLDQHDKAVEHYENALRLNRGDVQTHLLLARFYERTGNSFKAQQSYQAAIGLEPRNMRARELYLRTLLSRLTPGVASREQQQLVQRIHTELNEMMRLGRDEAPTRRCAALVRYLMDRNTRLYQETLTRMVEENPDDLQAREDIAKLALDQRNYELARQQAEEILQRDPGSPAALELLAATLVKVIDWAGATRQLEHMLDLYPNRESWLKQWVTLELLEQRYDRAIAGTERLLTLDSVVGRADKQRQYQSQLIQCYLQARRFDRALEIATRWLDEAPNDDVRNVVRSYLLAIDNAAEQYDRLVDRVRPWHEADPENPKYLRTLVAGLAKANRAAEAVTLALSWLAKNPRDPNRVEFVIDVLEYSRQYDQAIEIARAQFAAAEKPEEQLRGYAVVFGAQLTARRYDDAIRVLQEMIAAGERLNTNANVVALWRKQLVHVMVQAGRYDEAIRVLDGMLEEVARQLQARFAEIDFAVAGQIERASTEEERKAIAEQATDQKRAEYRTAQLERAELLKSQSWAYTRSGRSDLGEQRLREAYAINPNDVGINNDLGYTLADAGKNLKEAEKMIAVAVGESPTTGPYLDSYGWVFYKQGRFDEAVRWLKRATGTERGEDVVIFDHLGDAYWRNGDKDEAVASWKRALKIHADELASNQAEADEETIRAIEAKLAAVAAGQEPKVAPLGQHK